MKVSHAQDNVIASRGLQQTGGFKIAATGHAFKMLSSGLYSDKVRAVLREIGCNAYDAHIEAGCADRPIRVKLPNALDQQFYIQDWGPGLSHDSMMELYTTYFQSTKQTSNDFTGAFGLGSKSPFSYIDSFNVVSCHGGSKRTYVLYLANDGAPTVSLMSEEPTDADWPTGVRVSFAVKDQDFEEFKAKAQDVFKWFKVTPEVRGSQPIDPIRYRSDREEFRLQHDGGDPMLLMGNVAYPLDFNKCNVEEPYDPKKGQQIRNYARCTRGFVLVMPIGSVRPVASREAIDYDPAGIKAIQERLDLSMRKLGNDVVERLERAVTGGWAELCKVRDIIDEGLPGTVRYDFAVFGKALGLDKAKVDLLKPFISKSEVEVPKEAGEKAGCRLIYIKPHGRGSGKPTHSSISNGVSYGGKAKLSVNLDTVVAQGACGYAVPRARLAVAKGLYKQVLVFCQPSKGTKVPAAEIEHEARKVAGLLGGVPVIDLEDLEAPPITKGASKKKPKGWVPTLPATQEFTVLDMGKQEKKLLGDMKDQYFACYVARTSWGSTTKKHRLYEKSDKDDQDLDWETWTRVWSNYVHVESKLALPGAPRQYAILRAREIKEIRLPQLGWTRIYDAVQKYVKQPEVAEGLRKLIKKRVLVAPTELSRWNAGWMSSVACLHYKGRLAKSVQARLAELGLMDMVQGMADAAKSGKEEKTPAEITAYQELVQHFRLPNELAKDMQDAASVEDVDAMFLERFPRAAACNVGHLDQFDTRGDLADYLLFVLGRQK